MGTLLYDRPRRADRHSRPLVGQPVQTPLGLGRVVHVFRDGTAALELDSGGGVVYPVSEVESFLRGGYGRAQGQFG